MVSDASLCDSQRLNHQMDSVPVDVSKEESISATDRTLMWKAGSKEMLHHQQNM